MSSPPARGPLVPIKARGHLDLKEQKRPIRGEMAQHFVCFPLMQNNMVTPTNKDLITGKVQLSDEDKERTVN